MAPRATTHQLEFLSGPLQGRVVALEAITIVGRLAGECDLVVADASVSRRHARLELAPGGLRIVDQGSRNGVWIGAKRVEEALLGAGEEFRLGEVRLRYRAAGVAAPVPDLEVPLEELDLELPELDLPELDLPERDQPERDQPAPPASPARGTVPTAPSAPRAPAASRTERASAAATRGILQYSRHEGSAGLAQGDFAQLPGWLKAVAIALALAVFALVFALAFRGGAWLRGADGGAPESGGETEAPNAGG